MVTGVVRMLVRSTVCTVVAVIVVGITVVITDVNVVPGSAISQPMDSTLCKIFGSLHNKRRAEPECKWITHQ